MGEHGDVVHELFQLRATDLVALGEWLDLPVPYEESFGDYAGKILMEAHRQGKMYELGLRVHAHARNAKRAAREMAK